MEDELEALQAMLPPGVCKVSPCGQEITLDYRPDELPYFVSVRIHLPRTPAADPGRPPGGEIGLDSNFISEDARASLLDKWGTEMAAAPDSALYLVSQVNADVSEMLATLPKPQKHAAHRPKHGPEARQSAWGDAEGGAVEELGARDSKPQNPQPSKLRPADLSYDRQFYSNPRGFFDDATLKRMCVLRSSPFEVMKSVFFCHTANVRSAEEAGKFVCWVKLHRDVCDATHNIVAWRIHLGGGEEVREEDLEEHADDDGEHAAAAKVLFLLQKMEVLNRVVVVTRHWGGVLLGPQRFKCINEAAKDAVELAREKDPGFICTKKGKAGERKKGR